MNRPTRSPVQLTHLASDAAEPASNVPRKINIALQGGGAHGAFGWGVLDRLMEDDRLQIDGMSATSAGAMNATVYAYGYSTGGREGARKMLEQFWRKVSDAGSVSSPIQSTPVDAWLRAFGIKEPLAYRAFEFMTHVYSPYEFNPLNLNPLRDVLADTVDFTRLQHCNKTTLRLCATSVRTGKPASSATRRSRPMSCWRQPASRCSSRPSRSMASIIGTAATSAIGDLSADLRHELARHPRRAHQPDRPGGIAEAVVGNPQRVNEISFNSSLMREMRAIAFVSKLIDEEW